MAEQPPPHSTFVKMDVPDVATPNWPPVHRQAPQESYVPTFCHTPTQFSRIAQPGAHVQFASPPLGGSTPAQSFPQEQKNPEPMQLCTPPHGISSSATASPPSPPSSGVQYDLPGTLPTPGREIGHLTAQAQGSWDQLHDFLTKQEKAVIKLKSNSSSHESQITELVGKIDEIKRQLSTTLSTNKQQAETESDQTIKAMKFIITKELRKIENNLMSEVRCMVQQLQFKIQLDIKAVQQHFQRDYGQLLKESSQLTLLTDKLFTNMKELQTKMEAKFESQEKRMADLSEKSITLHNHLPPSPVTFPAAATTVVKSDHIKLTFPMFGQSADDPDPLLYITCCQDFLAVHPVMDTDILATFRTVLYGTARDWWEVARSSITTLSEFQSAFLAAFLAEDYEYELAERVHHRIQGEKESILDFAITYRALCKRWKPSLTEADILRMILKNIKPYLASHLRCRVTTNVEELVRLGHQLEKDHEQQKQCDSKAGSKPLVAQPRGVNSTQPTIQCWRCK